MAQNPNLIPTVITDVNGKVTTVHKKQSGVAAGAKRIPAPAVAQQAVQKPQTPLNLPPALSREERDELIAHLAAIPNFWGSDTSGMTDWVDDTGFALIKEYLETDRITPMEIKHITGIARVQGWGKTEVTNMLLVTERVRKDTSIDSQARGWTNNVVHSLPYNVRDTEGKYTSAIRTEEALTSATAVTTFVLRKFYEKDNNLGLVKTVRQNRAWRSPEELIVISNKHLDALIRERPQDLDRIISYVERNHMHASNKKPVNVLREFLDEDLASAIDEGWL